MDYQKDLAYLPLINKNINGIVESLLNGGLTKQQFHNKKSYAKRTKDLNLILELTISFEIYSLLKEVHCG